MITSSNARDMNSVQLNTSYPRNARRKRVCLNSDCTCVFVCLHACKALLMLLQAVKICLTSDRCNLSAAICNQSMQHIEYKAYGKWFTVVTPCLVRMITCIVTCRACDAACLAFSMHATAACHCLSAASSRCCLCKLTACAVLCWVSCLALMPINHECQAFSYWWAAQSNLALFFLACLTAAS